MAKQITKTVCGKTYILTPTKRFKTSYGYAGSNGYYVRVKDTGYPLGIYKTVAEFVKDRKRMCKKKRR